MEKKKKRNKKNSYCNLCISFLLCVFPETVWVTLPTCYHSENLTLAISICVFNFSLQFDSPGWNCLLVWRVGGFFWDFRHETK